MRSYKKLSSIAFILALMFVLSGCSVISSVKEKFLSEDSGGTNEVTDDFIVNDEEETPLGTDSEDSSQQDSSFLYENYNYEYSLEVPNVYDMEYLPSATLEDVDENAKHANFYKGEDLASNLAFKIFTTDAVEKNKTYLGQDPVATIKVANTNFYQYLISQDDCVKMTDFGDNNCSGPAVVLKSYKYDYQYLMVFYNKTEIDSEIQTVLDAFVFTGDGEEPAVK
ncbi:MAG: hypothetical protein UR28_C0003G0036 [Candidatus Peregrinibacteria bacterium GW2011_GWF2_33_10]|nr:MAG: hypothetical protein UR28_C0003G0036 [Candidatus Peregrinibacteria bacterium GW2011_GWF2_33_10]OGJ46672.1 MAG: hypothetical protein A2272_04660 [Candidatus Peregrinibacteria bacterium RIFOXYA12_FULL_33_12]OGJ51817.1 MAG: hypothetical protein A2307_05065 [Candidatus Peregrinibacteria bacterium RIFOXYB2_FULL_33_20]